MRMKFGISIEEDQVGVEAILLYKEELDTEITEEEFFNLINEKVIIQSYGFNVKNKE